MSNRKMFLILFFAVAFVAVSFAFRGLQDGGLAQAIDATFLRGAPAAAEGLTTDERIAFWQSRVRPGVSESLNLMHLAQAFIDRARESGEGVYYEQAEAALEQALAFDPNHPPTLALLGAIRLSNHDFRGALEAAERAYALDQRAFQALATTGDAYLELGEVDAAEAAYLLLDERQGGPEAAARLSRLAWIQGDPAGAIARMTEAESEARELGYLGEPLAWYQVQLGELHFNTGQVWAAERFFRASVESFPDYHIAMMGLARTAAACGDLDAAIALMEPLAARLPDGDHLALLGDFYTLDGRSDVAEEQYALVGANVDPATLPTTAHARELALFLAGHELNLPLALELAQRELDVRQDIYTYDTLAWMLYQNGRYDEAAEAMAMALAEGTQDAILFYHAGMIAAARGERNIARAMLERALKMNPYFDWFDAPQAQAMLNSLAGQS